MTSELTIATMICSKLRNSAYHDGQLTSKDRIVLTSAISMLETCANSIAFDEGKQNVDTRIFSLAIKFLSDEKVLKYIGDHLGFYTIKDIDSGDTPLHTKIARFSPTERVMYAEKIVQGFSVINRDEILRLFINIIYNKKLSTDDKLHLNHQLIRFFSGLDSCDDDSAGSVESVEDDFDFTEELFLRYRENDSRIDFIGIFFNTLYQ